ncbi:tRNA pseudouridine(38-40) synthase TruA [Brevibacillus porteri]|uniref:tRNA pseudouridine synthase A n=1 Tax=Brevibacillus porteri TaxID=2126350 RepID=A0ABX5FMU1_9BACL|nr:tRNA pseudouridine(38-40) synthase TruA [Brevibacillus porteri]MED1800690.1 tRNA pseudouridine(38-40) synthase TruA [Brevibacillus porteri]MED2133192.1 tRNA pseudouridine(38-40) synthase TruA [Brevibacillus porteri]MED2746054.1 tRNA pseudouridine(38-40) synthase TruA [Brevibacillus porteri]MED2817371.1 tRNA pseudouridine(38-40) synthase TruA [Brevibacillus porteri]MED2896180.1 tRNA pseudouridine(38-40) synthase TruA [Brevibacillus porteri]
MKRLRCVLAYDGTDFSGFQVQPDQVTVQGEIEAALNRVTGEDIQVFGSGRTDAGVHARGQVIHFDTSSNIPMDKWRFVLNNQLPDSIVIRTVEEVDASFHARFDVQVKEYRYCIDNTPVADVFRHRYADHVRFPLDVDAMQQAAHYLVGEHDFTSFCSAKTYVEDKVRTVYGVTVEKSGDEVWVTCRGNGFLYNMVRIIVGTLVEVGQGKRNPAELREILAACDREKAGKTAPAKGLTMWEVVY